MVCQDIANSLDNGGRIDAVIIEVLREVNKISYVSGGTGLIGMAIVEIDTL
jgi:hypothetical protein